MATALDALVAVLVDGGKVGPRLAVLGAEGSQIPGGGESGRQVSQSHHVKPVHVGLAMHVRGESSEDGGVRTGTGTGTRFTFMLPRWVNDRLHPSSRQRKALGPTWFLMCVSTVLRWAKRFPHMLQG